MSAAREHNTQLLACLRFSAYLAWCSCVHLRTEGVFESASERLLPVVDSHVGLEITLLGKLLVASLYWTNEGLEASLHNFVNSRKQIIHEYVYGS